jgi:hypothetical protein
VLPACVSVRISLIVPIAISGAVEPVRSVFMPGHMMVSSKADNVEAERQCCEIRLRAERKAGELLAKTEKAKGARQPGTNRGATRSGGATTSTNAPQMARTLQTAPTGPSGGRQRPIQPLIIRRPRSGWAGLRPHPRGAAGQERARGSYQF